MYVCMCVCMYAGNKVYYANWLKLSSGKRSNSVLGEGGATVLIPAKSHSRKHEHHSVNIARGGHRKR